MKKGLIVVFCIALGSSALGAGQSQAAVDVGSGDSFWTGLRAAIERHLGRPYVWGSAGMKSFDCSGFVWCVMMENGILTKRTTARKYYMMLPKARPGDESRFGTVVFFDNLKHVGIVDTKSTFYHAQLSRGTNLSEFNSFWRQKIYGFRRMPVP